MSQFIVKGTQLAQRDSGKVNMIFGNFHVSKCLEQAIGVRIGKLITELKLTKLPVKFSPLSVLIIYYSVRKLWTVGRMKQDV